jgi:hypothetical protein
MLKIDWVDTVYNLYIGIVIAKHFFIVNVWNENTSMGTTTFKKETKLCSG